MSWLDDIKNSFVEKFSGSSDTSALENKLSHVENNLQIFNSEKTEKSEETSQYLQDISNVQADNSIADAKTQITTANNNYHSAQCELSSAESLPATIKNEDGEEIPNPQRINAIAAAKSAVESAKSALNEAERNLKELEDKQERELTELEAKYGMLQEKINDLDSKISDLENDKKNIQAEIQTAKNEDNEQNNLVNTGALTRGAEMPQSTRDIIGFGSTQQDNNELAYKATILSEIQNMAVSEMPGAESGINADEIRTDNSGKITSAKYSDGENSYTVEYEYDSNEGYVTSAVLTSYNNGVKNEARTLTFGRSENIETEQIDEIDENGRTLKRHELEYTSDGELAFYSQYERDKSGKLKELYIEDFDNAVGFSKQGNINDCWLLSGLNSLSYNEKGNQIISDSIIDNGDDSYTVMFNGIGEGVTITSEELEAAFKSNKYSKGDKDVLLLELGFEAIIKKAQKGQIDIPGFHNALSITQTQKGGKSSLDWGNLEDVVFLLTGNDAETIMKDGPFVYDSCVNQILDEFEENPEDRIVQVGFVGSKDTQGTEIMDIYGQPIFTLPKSGGHAFSVKKVDGDNVTIVNPWDSSKEYIVDRSYFWEYTGAIQDYKYKSA